MWRPLRQGSRQGGSASGFDTDISAQGDAGWPWQESCSEGRGQGEQPGAWQQGRGGGGGGGPFSPGTKPFPAGAPPEATTQEGLHGEEGGLRDKSLPGKRPKPLVTP